MSSNIVKAFFFCALLFLALHAAFFFCFHVEGLFSLAHIFFRAIISIGLIQYIGLVHFYKKESGRLRRGIILCMGIPLVCFNINNIRYWFPDTATNLEDIDVELISYEEVYPIVKIELEKYVYINESLSPLVLLDDEGIGYNYISKESGYFEVMKYGVRHNFYKDKKMYYLNNDYGMPMYFVEGDLIVPISRNLHKDNLSSSDFYLFKNL